MNIVLVTHVTGLAHRVRRVKRRAQFSVLMILPQLMTGQSVRDSAGVRIVSYAGNAQPAAIWSLVQPAMLQIGGRSGTGFTSFSGLVAAMRLNDSTVVVADQGSAELRFFDLAGRFLRKAAGRGRGPGEHQTLDDAMLRNDTVIALENRRAARVFTATGRFVREIVFPPIRGYITNPAVGAFSSTSIVVRAREVKPQPARGMFISDSIALIAVGGQVPLRRLGRFPNAELYTAPGLRGEYPVGFSPSLTIAVFSNAFCTGYSEAYELRCADTLGRPFLIVHRDVIRRRVLSRDRAVLAAVVVGKGADGSRMFSGSLQRHRETVMRSLKYARFHPSHGRLLAGSAGELWVQEYQQEDALRGPRRVPASAVRWNVYSLVGQWIGAVMTPPRFVLLEAGREYVLGALLDDDDVETAVMFRLERDVPSRANRRKAVVGRLSKR